MERSCSHHAAPTGLGRVVVWRGGYEHVAPSELAPILLNSIATSVKGGLRVRRTLDVKGNHCLDLILLALPCLRHHLSCIVTRRYANTGSVRDLN